MPEDVAIAICANYGQVRKLLQERKLGRSFFRPHLKGGKHGKVRGKGKGKRKGGNGSDAPADRGVSVRSA